MSTNVIKSQGCSIARGVGSPLVYTTIAEVQSIGGPTADNPEIDVTALGDTAKAFISGLTDNGEISISGGFDPTSASQQQVFTDQAAGSTNEMTYKITFTNSPQTTVTFTAWVKTAQVAIGVDSAVNLSFTLRVTSALTWAW